MKILSVETSCDETALALVESSGTLEAPIFNVLGTSLYSQAQSHAEFGGVFPDLAKREHAKNLIPLLKNLFEKTGISKPIKNEIKNSQKIRELLKREHGLVDELISFLSQNSKPEIDMISVTEGPGLEPALWVGINFAIALSLEWQIPLMPVNHMEGHIASVLIETESLSSSPEIIFPAIALLISGGHTELVYINKWNEYKLLGSTRDDAVGEAYDKVARMLKLPYPGGPEISKLAEEARTENFDEILNFPRPMINSGDLDFSFSGLKTSVLYTLEKMSIAENFGDEIPEKTKKQIAFEFENAVVEVLVSKTEKALSDTNAKTLIVGGGVIANKFIRSNLEKLGQQKSDYETKVLVPEINLATDNAVMIAVASFVQSFFKKAKIAPEIKAQGNLQIASSD